MNIDTQKLLELLKGFKILINLQHVIVVGLGGYIMARIAQQPEDICRLVGMYCAAGGSLGDVISFGRSVKNDLQSAASDTEKTEGS